MKSENSTRRPKIILAELQNNSRQPNRRAGREGGPFALVLPPPREASRGGRRHRLLHRQRSTARRWGSPMSSSSRCRCSAQTEEAFEKFEKAVQRVPEILECHLMSGQFDYLLRVVASDAQDYERIHRSRISRLPGVQRIQSLAGAAHGEELGRLSRRLTGPPRRAAASRIEPQHDDPGARHEGAADDGHGARHVSPEHEAEHHRPDHP